MAVRVDFNTGTSASPVWSDITSFVRSVSIVRGKDELLDGFSAGSASIVLDNRDRSFDPLYASSPYVGAIVPRRAVRVFYDYGTATTAVRTNLILNPSFEYESGGSVVAWSRTAFNPPTRVSFDPLFGTYRTDGADDSSYLLQTTASVSPNTVYTASGYAKTDYPLTDMILISMRLAWLDSSGAQVGDELFTSFTPSDAEWTRLIISDVSPPTAVSCRLGFGGEYNPDATGIIRNTYRLDGVQLEEGLIVGSYLDGDQTDNAPAAIYAWTGTPGNSPSTLTYQVETGQQFVGFIDDWDLNYEIGGDNTATIKATDAFSLLSNQAVEPQTMPIERSGLRIARLLSEAGIQFAGNARELDAGVKFLGTDITDGNNALSYFQEIELSELGQLFVAKNGDLTYLDASRNNPNPASSTATFADDGTGVPFTTLEVVYGSEQLTNTLTVDYPTGSATVSNTDSIDAYGVTSLTVDTLNQNSTDAEYLADYYTTRFGQPQYRVETITVNLLSLSDANQTAVLGLELGDVVTVKFTPEVAPQIVQYGKVVRINTNITDGAKRYEIEFGLETFSTFPMILNDAEYGKLDDDYVLGF